MTQNLFVGADLLVLGRQSFRGKSLNAILREVEGKVDRVMDAIEFHDFAARAAGVANQVRLARPDILLLQEAMLLRRRACGGQRGWVAEAQTCVFDYLSLLERALQAEGLDYRVAIVSDNFDEEAPSQTHGTVRFIDRDAILVRANLTVSSSRSRHFTDQWERKVAFRTVSLKKGYQEVTVEKEGRQFRAVNLHIERLGQHKKKQNAELLARYAAPDLPTVIGGDFNADPGIDVHFFALWQTAYRDAWSALHGDRGGGTCCFRIPLVDTRHHPGSRWDLSLASRHFQVHRARLVKDRVRAHGRPARRLWLSDHAGVVAELSLE